MVILILCLLCDSPCFVRGDASGDGVVTPSDASAILEYLFCEGSLGCLDAADANDDGTVDISDAVRVLMWFHADGHGPGWRVVSDTTPDALGCVSGIPCS